MSAFLGFSLFGLSWAILNTAGALVVDGLWGTTPIVQSIYSTLCSEAHCGPDFGCFVLLFLFGFSQQPGRIINCGHEVAVRGRAGLCLPPPPHPNIRQPGEPRSKSLFASESTSGFPHTEIHISLVDHFPWIFLSSYTRYYFLSNVYS